MAGAWPVGRAAAPPRLPQGPGQPTHAHPPRAAHHPRQPPCRSPFAAALLAQPPCISTCALTAALRPDVGGRGDALRAVLAARRLVRLRLGLRLRVRVRLDQTVARACAFQPGSLRIVASSASRFIIVSRFSRFSLCCARMVRRRSGQGRNTRVRAGAQTRGSGPGAQEGGGGGGGAFGAGIGAGRAVSPRAPARCAPPYSQPSAPPPAPP